MQHILGMQNFPYFLNMYNKFIGFFPYLTPIGITQVLKC